MWFLMFNITKTVVQIVSLSDNVLKVISVPREPMGTNNKLRLGAGNRGAVCWGHHSGLNLH